MVDYGINLTPEQAHNLALAMIYHGQAERYAIQYLCTRNREDFQSFENYRDRRDKCLNLAGLPTMEVLNHIANGDVYVLSQEDLSKALK